MNFYKYSYLKFKIIIYKILIFISFSAKRSKYKIIRQAHIKNLNNIFDSDEKFEIKNNVFKDFCSINKSYWESKSTEFRKDIILVEGFLAESGPNYLIRTGIITKALEKISGANPVVLIFDSEAKEKIKKKLYQSFNINSFISLNDYYNKNLSIYDNFKIIFLARIYQVVCYILLKINAKKLFFKISFNKVKFGDMLHDEMLKDVVEKKLTISTFTKKDYQILKKVFIYFHIFNNLTKKYNIKYYVSTHAHYVTYGLIVRFFIKKNIFSIETTDDLLFFYEQNYNKNPSFHSHVKKLVQKKLDFYYKNDDLTTLIKSELSDRFSGKNEQLDSKLAFINKKIYSKKELKEILNIQNNYPIVFIFAHIFTDAPQCSNDGTIFADFYEWLIETIKCASTINNVNWIVKSHPSVKAYNEEGQVEFIIDNYKNEGSNIYMCPDDFNSSSMIKFAKAAITCLGTAGIEFSCCGIPVILAGRPFYSGFGFTYDPGNKNEYYSLLHNIKNINKLNKKQIRTAHSVYGCFNDLLNKDFTFVDSKIKGKVWGIDGAQDTIGAFKIMNERLKYNNPRSSSLFKNVIKHCQSDKQ